MRIADFALERFFARWEFAVRHLLCASDVEGWRMADLLALAVAQAAPVLLLDEPTVHLDLRHQVGAMELLTDLNERDGTAIVAVLHDLGLASLFFPRLVLIDRGRLVADGTPAEVLTDERIRDVFGVDPSIVRRVAPGLVAPTA